MRQSSGVLAAAAVASAISGPGIAKAETMFDGMSNTVVYVSDQEAARAFYTEKLQMPVVHDDPFEDQSRWLTVRAGDASTVILLYQPPDGDPRQQRIGGWTGLTFTTPDIYATVAQLETAGVPYVEVWEADWGALETIITDPDGNEFYVIQLLD